MRKTNFTSLKGLVMSAFMMYGITNANAQGLVCQDHVNVSLDETCKVDFSSMVSASGASSIVIKNGNSILTQSGANTYDVATSGLVINKVYTYELYSGTNKCWGTLKFEDKLAPKIVCPSDISVTCDATYGYTANEIEIVANSVTPAAGQITRATYLAFNKLLILPDVTECSNYKLFYSDSKNLACGNGTVGTLTRTFRVTDAYGNTTSCAQKFTILAPSLTIAAPDNITVNVCAKDINLANYTPAAMAASSNSAVKAAAYPAVAGGDCMTSVTYTDKTTDDACGKKIVRSWVVVDMCTGKVITLGANRQGSVTQVISLTDNEAPVFAVSALPDMTITTGASSCLSAQQVAYPTVTDNCCIGSAVLAINGVNYAAAISNCKPSSVAIIGLPVGTYKGTWKVVDACGNATTQDQNIIVSDLIPPVAVADQNTNVSLTLDCTATVNASSFDDGSLDNCCLDVNRFEVKRMTELTDAKYADLKGNKSYSDQITFVKEDLAGGCSNTLQVLFRVWDCYGNSNIAMVNVKIEDKIGPVAAGKDTMVMCGNTALGTQWLESWEARFKGLNTLQYPPVAGTNPGYFDNCDATVSWGTVGGSINQCANGAMSRTVTVKDKCDRSTTATFTYNSGHQAEFEVTLPKNQSLNCSPTSGQTVPSKADAIAAVRKTLTTIAGCPVVAVDIKSEETFAAVNGACYRLKRTWVVSSLCHNGMMRGDKGFSDTPVMGTGIDYVYKSKFDGQDPSGKLNPDDDKYVEYIQIIDVNDTEKPTIANAIEPVLSAESKCGLKMTVGGFDATDACAPIVAKSWSLLDANKAPVAASATTYVGGTSFPATHTFTTADFGKKFYVRYKAEDKCGNVDIKDYLVDVKDLVKPTAVCYQGLSVDLMPTTGEVWLSATMFDAASFDGCQADASNATIAPAVANPAPANNARQFSKDKTVELRLERATGTPPVFGTSVPTTNMIWVGCVGVVPIRLWAIDAAGNADYCDTYVDVQNNMGATPKDGNCPIVDPTGSKIAGSVKSANGNAIENALVTVKANTLANGHVSSAVVKGTYEASIGTSTSATISADKNDQPLNGVSTYDLVLISKHILGTQNIADKYALIAADVNNNGKVAISDVVELRKMILGLQSNFNNNKSWRFFDATMNEEVALNNIAANSTTTVNFTGIKVGDINGNANAASAQRTAGTHEFVVADRNIAAGEEVTVTLNGTEGFGFTMNYDANALQVVNVDENSAVIENGTITTAQVGSEFKVTFKATAATTLSNAIAINSNITAAEAVVNGELYNATLKFNNKVNGFALLQNQPNPFRGATMISFNAPAAGDYTITITDIAGRTVKAMNGNAVKGLNNVSVEMNNAGVYNYTVTTGNFTATKKMVVME